MTTNDLLLSIVTPAGGSEPEIQTTVTSVQKAAKANPAINFEHILILNNGAIYDAEVISKNNLTCKINNINPIANRSLARNLGTELTAATSDYVLYLDAGDAILPLALRELQLPAKEVHTFSSIVMTSTNYFLRKVRPERMIMIVNPFYIGATWVPTEIARRFPFPDGRKEDWKVWVAMKKEGIAFKSSEQSNYVYRIKSRTNHAKRKAKLVREQFDFFRSFQKMGLGASCAALIGHYFIHTVWWFTRPSQDIITFEQKGWLKED